MADQVGEQVKDLGSDWNQAGAALELAPVGIEHEIFEQIAQLMISRAEFWFLPKVA
jgi:hypothetical protein